MLQNCSFGGRGNADWRIYGQIFLQLAFSTKSVKQMTTFSTIRKTTAKPNEQYLLHVQLYMLLCIIKQMKRKSNERNVTSIQSQFYHSLRADSCGAKLHDEPSNDEERSGVCWELAKQF